jgi:hypothetical protein
MSDIIYTPPASPSGPTGSGAAGQVTFWSAATVLTGSNNLFWDNTNGRLGIGNIVPGAKLDVHGTGVIQQLNGTTTNNSYLDFQNAGATKWRLGNTYNAGQNRFSLFNAAGTTEVVTTFQTGNVAINSTTDAGYKLDVNGTARVQGTLTGVTQYFSTGAAATSHYLEFLSTSSTNSYLNLRRSAGANGVTAYYLNNGTAYFSTDNGSGETRLLASVGGYYLTFFSNGLETMRLPTSNNVLIGTTTDIPSSILTLQSTTKGFLPPRMTNAQRTAISSPAVGLIVYCTDAVEGLYIYKSTGWTFII